MGKSLSSKVEQLVHDAIEDISNELEINCENYPEVYYLHKSFSFNRLGLPKREKKEFDIVKKFGSGIYFYRPKIVLLSTQNPAEIYEEAGHFLHFNHSGLNFNGKKDEDILFMNAIIETIGYFCSKLGDPSRTPIFSNYPDYFRNSEECLKLIDSDGLDPNSFFVYQQGYGIGEKLFNYYISGIISKEKIRTLMSEKFDGKYEATYEFIKLKHFFDGSFLVGEGIKKMF